MRYPAVPLAVALLVGVSAGALPSETAAAALPADALAAVVWLGLVCAVAALATGQGRAFAWAALATVGLAGCGLGLAADRDAHAPPLREALAAIGVFTPGAEMARAPVQVTGVVAEDASAVEDGARLAMQVRDVTFEGHRRRVGGLVWLTVAGAVPEAAVARWTRGRVVHASVLLRRPARYLNPGVPDHERALLRRGVALVGAVKSAGLVEVIAPGPWHDEVAARVRARARRVFDRHVSPHDPRSGAIVRAVVIGDRTGLDDETEDRMQAAGTYHVLAISGGNIAILAGLLFVALRVIPVRSPLRETVVMLALAVYGWLVGGGASVLRATTVAEVMLAARALDRRSPSFNAMAVSALAGLSWTPLMLFDPGAWLTYGASLAILVGAGRSSVGASRQPAARRAVVALVAASVAAEVALFPVTAFVFSRVTAAGVVVNLAAVPLMSAAQAGALLLLAVEPLSAVCAGWVGRGVHLAAWGLVESGRLVDVAPWLTARLAAPSWSVVAAYYVAAVTTLVVRQAPRGSGRQPWWRRAALWGGSSAWLAAGSWIVIAPAGDTVPPPGRLRLTFIDVGQGHAALVQVPGGRSLLVDAGGAGGGGFDVGSRVIAPVLWRRGVRRLTCLVLTHGDGDHVNGALAVVRDFVPQEVWEGVPVPPQASLRDLRRAAVAGGAAWRTVQRGDRVSWGDVDLVVRHPRLPEWERQRVRNDDSIVVDVRYRQVSMVLTGDVETTGETDLADGLEPAAVRVLLAAHHGSASSSSPPLLAVLRPQVAIVSAGRGNRFGHPHAAVLARLAAAGARVFRTDTDGAITLDTDGRTLELGTWTGRSARIGR